MFLVQILFLLLQQQCAAFQALFFACNCKIFAQGLNYRTVLLVFRRREERREMKTRPDYGSSSVSQRKGFEHSGMQRRKVITRQVQLHFNLRWEFIRENKKVTKKKRKKLSFILVHFLGRVLVFLFSYFLVSYYKFPPLKVQRMSSDELVNGGFICMILRTLSPKVNCILFP